MNRFTSRATSVVVSGLFAVIGVACTRTTNAAGKSSADALTSSISGSSESDDASTPVTLLPPGPAFGAGVGDSSMTSASDGLSLRREAPERVAVVGDSLTVASQDLITKSLRSLGTAEVIVNGVEGRRMTGRSARRPPGSDAIRDVVDDGQAPDVWVIELGTNDVGAQVHPKEFRSDMETLISLLPPESNIVWVNIFVRGRAEATKQANQIINSVASSQPNMLVADWYSLASSTPELITSDGIHLRSAGEAAYSSMITDAVLTAHANSASGSTSRSTSSSTS